VDGVGKGDVGNRWLSDEHGVEEVNCEHLSIVASKEHLESVIDERIDPDGLENHRDAVECQASGSGGRDWQGNLHEETCPPVPARRQAGVGARSR
jgi:hypothetical protein